jgi:hypothetical protein
MPNSRLGQDSPVMRVISGTAKDAIRSAIASRTIAAIASLRGVPSIEYTTTSERRNFRRARQVGIVEFVSVAQAFMGRELNILAAKRMVVSRGKLPERHSKRATDFRVQLMLPGHDADEQC